MIKPLPIYRRLDFSQKFLKRILNKLNGSDWCTFYTSNVVPVVFLLTQTGYQFSWVCHSAGGRVPEPKVSVRLARTSVVLLVLVGFARRWLFIDVGVPSDMGVQALSFFWTTYPLGFPLVLIVYLSSVSMLDTLLSLLRLVLMS